MLIMINGIVRKYAFHVNLIKVNTNNGMPKIGQTISNHLLYLFYSQGGIVNFLIISKG